MIAANSAGSQVQFLTGAHIEGGTLSAISGAGFFGSTQSQVVLDGTTQGPLTNASRLHDQQQPGRRTYGDHQ